MHPPKVDAAFDEEGAGDIEQSQQAGTKRKAKQDNMHTLAKRQRAWLSRSTPGAQPARWRPIKVHRAGARRWASALDLQFQVITGAFVLSMFQKERLVIMGVRGE